DVFRLLVPVCQVGMNHIALNRTWAYDRYFDDEIVIRSWFQPWQHRHLCPAFDLEYTDRVGLAQHLVDLGIFGKYAEIALYAVMLLDQVEALAQRRQHAERQNIDLVYLERVE